ncbi:hypothetical protein Misp01_80190 [Microtetraspora sp. NBRC 13810]|uniref:hypothetical protein n=1 Tax=Microtetraspora sp. NBRC 13810 TaxID=3030990 RepID=UPI0024A1AAE2|nr:hypothetical protein [Microtetraspora sp. NBRC 13810]GLW12891.1 hypothetical protein Misp01_80190 [Microtetraspora sp. NBRC 13810]
MIFAPVIPTLAVLLLAALWGFSVFAGWGLEAFCSQGESAEDCARRLDTVATFSSVFAVIGAGCSLAAWLFASPRSYMSLMAGAIAAWLAAEGVLFVGGMLVG